MESSIMVPVVLIGGLFAIAVGVICFNYLQSGNIFKCRRDDADTRRFYIQAPRSKQKAVAKAIENSGKKFELIDFDYGAYETWYTANYSFRGLTPPEVEQLVASIIESVGDEKNLRVRVS